MHMLLPTDTPMQGKVRCPCGDQKNTKHICKFIYGYLFGSFFKKFILTVVQLQISDFSKKKFRALPLTSISEDGAVYG